MGSYFPNRWPLSYLNLTKNMKTYIRRQQHKNFFKHQDIKQKEPPQKYRLGTISNTKLLAGLNRFYMAITSPSVYEFFESIFLHVNISSIKYGNVIRRNITILRNIFFFFFLIQFYVPFKLFTHIETNQSVGGAKTGVPGEKPPDTPASRTWLVSHMNSCPVRGANPHR